MTVKSGYTAEKLNPGSYNNYRATHEISEAVEAIERHSEAIHAYRLALAAELGIALEDLHDRRASDNSGEQAA